MRRSREMASSALVPTITQTFSSSSSEPPAAGAAVGVSSSPPKRLSMLSSSLAMVRSGGPKKGISTKTTGSLPTSKRPDRSRTCSGGAQVSTHLVYMGWRISRNNDSPEA